MYLFSWCIQNREGREKKMAFLKGGRIAQVCNAHESIVELPIQSRGGQISLSCFAAKIATR